MSIKFTKSQLEKIIKEEVSKLINEQAPPGTGTFGANLKQEICLEELKDEDGLDFIQNNFASLRRLLVPVVAKAKKAAGPKAVGFLWLADNVFLKKRVWTRVWGRVTRKSLITDPNRTAAGVDGFYEDIIGMMQNYVEILDNEVANMPGPPIDGDRLDPYDGFASPGFGAAYGRPSADQAFARKIWGPGQFADEIITIFLNWFCSGGKFGAAPAPAPAPVPGPDPAPDDTPIDDQGPPMPDDITEPDSTPPGGNSDYEMCRRFNRLAVKMTGESNVREAVKVIQVMLVNLGHSVKKDEIDSGFGPGTGFKSLQLGKANFKKAGIDGRCGPGTMGAVKRFQKSNNLKVDGLVGPETWPVLSSGGIEKTKMNAEVPLKQQDSVAINTGEEEIKTDSLREVKDQLSRWKKLWS